MNKKRKNLIQEITIWLVASFIIVILVNGACIFYSASKNYIDYVQWRAETVLFEIKDEFVDYKSLPWLVSYWKNHFKEMKLNEDEDVRLHKVERILNKYRVHSTRNVEPVLLSSFSEVEQRLFAEYCYLEMVTEINSYRADFDLADINCVSLFEDGSAIHLFKGSDGGKHQDGSYVLGDDWAYHPELHPAITKMYTEKKEKLYLEPMSSGITDEVFLYIYLPVISGGDIVCHIRLSVTLKKMILALGRNATFIEMINALLLFGCAVSILYLIYIKALKPLLHISSQLEEYSDTGDSRKIIQNLMMINSQNEIQRLSDDIADMIIEMERYSLVRQKRAAEVQRIRTEMEIAQRIQMGALSVDFDIFSGRRDVDLYASMKPAKSVGGDFYDFFFIDQDHLYIAIADVSGKGIPAAMFMMSAKSILANSARGGHTPAEILEISNELIFKNNGEQMFVTVWVGILDLVTGRLTAANAGHERPAIMQPGADFVLMKDKHGLVMGSYEGLTYEEYTVNLKPGAKIFVFTDGIVEASDKNKTLFGKDRMIKVLNDAKDLSPQKVIEEVHASVGSFVKGAKQFDDMTMLCLEYKAER